MKGAHHKICRRCEIDQALEQFRYTDNKRLSRRSVCSNCETAAKRKVAYKEQQKSYVKKKRRDPVWREREKITMQKYALTPNGRAKRLWLAARHRAKMYNLSFDISVARIEFALLIGTCERTGIPFNLERPNGTNFNPFAPSIDKKDAFAGYTNSNIQVVCNVYNLGKGQMTDDQFVEFCRVVVRFNDE